MSVGLAIVLLVAGSLGGFGLHRATDAQTVVFLLDASDSVSLENRAKARAYVADAFRAPAGTIDTG